MPRPKRSNRVASGKVTQGTKKRSREDTGKNTGGSSQGNKENHSSIAPLFLNETNVTSSPSQLNFSLLLNDTVAVSPISSSKEILLDLDHQQAICHRVSLFLTTTPPKTQNNSSSDSLSAPKANSVISSSSTASCLAQLVEQPTVHNTPIRSRSNSTALSANNNSSESSNLNLSNFSALGDSSFLFASISPREKDGSSGSSYTDSPVTAKDPLLKRTFRAPPQFNFSDSKLNLNKKNSINRKRARTSAKGHDQDQSSQNDATNRNTCQMQ